MASLRNAIPRRAHKERSQPSDRKRFGLLEKHKDYVLRARDFHKKEDAIRVLREKAALKNPDEFYFKMQNTVMREGVHQKGGDEKNKYTTEEIILMKSQDIRYVLNKSQAEIKKVEKLKSSLQNIDQKPLNQHVVFTDDGRISGKSSNNEHEQAALKLKPLPKRLQKRRNAAYRELQERTERSQKMMTVLQKMTLKKELMGKGRKRKLSQQELSNPEAGSVYKWKRERKK